MIIIRAIIFIVALAFGFILSGNLAGIDKIRDGGTDLAESVISSFQNQELTDAAVIDGDSSAVSKYATATNAKYLLIAMGVFFGVFSATIIGAGVIGLLGGVLFSPEIASVPVLADAAVSISNTVSSLWSDLITKLAEQQ